MSDEQSDFDTLICPECGEEIKPDEPHTACLDAVLARAGEE